MNGTTYIKQISLTIPLTKENVKEMRGTNIAIEDIRLIANKGFFGFRSGTFTVHKDHTGRITSIEKRFVERF